MAVKGGGKLERVKLFQFIFSLWVSASQGYKVKTSCCLMRGIQFNFFFPGFERGLLWWFALPKAERYAESSAHDGWSISPK